MNEEIKAIAMDLAMDGLLRELPHAATHDELLVSAVMGRFPVRRRRLYFPVANSWRFIAVAASLAIIAGVWWLWPRAGTGTGVEMRVAEVQGSGVRGQAAGVTASPSHQVAKAEGRLTEISGDVWVARADGTGQQAAAAVGAEVFAGETILTATNASAQFAYSDGSTLRIYRASTVVLSRTDAGPGLDLRRGAVDADIRKQPDGRRMRILGELMQAEIVGTQFRLMVQSETKSKWLGVREGVVEVSRVADGRKVALQAGCYAAVTPSLPYQSIDARWCPLWKGACQQTTGMSYP